MIHSAKSNVRSILTSGMSCEELRAIERQAHTRLEEALQKYDDLVASLQGKTVVMAGLKTVVMTAGELQDIQDAADRVTAADSAWIEAFKPYADCWEAHFAAGDFDATFDDRTGEH